MSQRDILLRYHEIALKGENRGWFEERLAMNARKLLRRSLGREAEIKVERGHARILVNAPWNEATREALSRLYGMSSFSTLRKVPTTLEDLAKAGVEEFRLYVETHGMPRSFRVRTRRTEKALPQNSMEIDHYVGGLIKDSYRDVAVDLKNAELSIGIELHRNESFVWTTKIPGPGGLPVGANGPVLALMSGGLDSPVAAAQVIRRGSPAHFLHFYGTPFVGPEVLEKVEDLVRIVNQLQPDPHSLRVVPFGKIQEKIALATTPKLRTILYRRMMVRIACEVARRIDCHALVTGESLGQVASQTVENLATIDSVSTLPILRPLIAHDKDEIIAKAHKMGSFDVSIRPGVDCCTLFADRHPAIRANLDTVLEQEKLFPVEQYVREAVDQLETRKV